MKIKRIIDWLSPIICYTFVIVFEYLIIFIFDKKTQTYFLIRSEGYLNRFSIQAKKTINKTT